MLIITINHWTYSDDINMLNRLGIIQSWIHGDWGKLVRKYPTKRDYVASDGCHIGNRS